MLKGGGHRSMAKGRERFWTGPPSGASYEKDVSSIVGKPRSIGTGSPMRPLLRCSRPDWI
jgi:hypothetical protein